jgi:hypothetical protein
MRRSTWRPKTNAQWNNMPYPERVAWIEPLDDAKILRQAAVRAEASAQPIEKILTAWVVNGYLDLNRKRDLVAALNAR